MNAFLLRWQYSFYAMLAYLASHTDRGDVQANMQSMADETYRLWCREQVNQQVNQPNYRRR